MNRLKQRFEMTFQIAPAPTGTQTDLAGATDLDDPAELAARRAAALRATLDLELALTRTQAAAKNAAEKRAFDEGLQSVQEYYAARRQAAIDAFEATEQTLARKRETIEAEVDPAKKQQESAKIDAQLAQARLTKENAIAAIQYEELQTVRALAAERLALEQKLLESQGKRHDAARLAIEDEIRKADELLRKQGVADAERLATIEQLRTTLETGINFLKARTPFLMKWRTSAPTSKPGSPPAFFPSLKGKVN
jgi:DNA segregation ATPase FtsK/SpoIIIE-like protein